MDGRNGSVRVNLHWNFSVHILNVAIFILHQIFKLDFCIFLGFMSFN